MGKWKYSNQLYKSGPPFHLNIWDYSVATDIMITVKLANKQKVSSCAKVEFYCDDYWLTGAYIPTSARLLSWVKTSDILVFTVSNSGDGQSWDMWPTSFTQDISHHMILPFFWDDVHSPLSGHLFLCGVELQQTQLTESSLQLLPAVLHLLLELHVDAAELLVLFPKVGLFTGQLPDPGLQLETKTGLTDSAVKLPDCSNIKPTCWLTVYLLLFGQCRLQLLLSQLEFLF